MDTSHEDPLTEAADTLTSLIEYYERQQSWIQRARETVRRVEQSDESPQPGPSARPSTQHPPSQLYPRPLPRPKQYQRLPGLNVNDLLQMYNSIVSERVESCKRTAELIREADRLSLEKFESSHPFDLDRPR